MVTFDIILNKKSVGLFKKKIKDPVGFVDCGLSLIFNCINKICYEEDNGDIKFFGKGGIREDIDNVCYSVNIEDFLTELNYHYKFSKFEVEINVDTDDSYFFNDINAFMKFVNIRR